MKPETRAARTGEGASGRRRRSLSQEDGPVWCTGGGIKTAGGHRWRRCNAAFIYQGGRQALIRVEYLAARSGEFIPLTPVESGSLYMKKEWPRPALCPLWLGMDSVLFFLVFLRGLSAM